MLDWQKSKHYRKPKTTPNRPCNPTGQNNRTGKKHHALTKREAHHAKAVRQSLVHPTTTGTHQKHAHPRGTQHQAHNNKKSNALAHYRVLKQHQHTQHTDQTSQPAEAAHTKLHNQANKSQTQVQPPFTQRQPHLVILSPLTPSGARSNGWKYNHEPTTKHKHPGQHTKPARVKSSTSATASDPKDR